MSKLNILYFEDDDDDLVAARIKVEDIAEIIACKTSDELNRLLESQSFDAILVDWSVGGILGEQSMVMMQAKQPAVPRIIITGTLNPRAAAVACQLGATDYIFKSDLERLPQAITNAVENARRKREMEERKQREIIGNRLETLGDLVVGLAHDANNISGIILVGIEVLRKNIVPEDERILDMILSAAQRASEMQKQLLAFGSGAEKGLKNVSAEYLLSELGTMIRGAFPSNIRLSIHTAPGTSAVHGDETQLAQVLLNLAVNSRQAMPDGGQLIVSAQNILLHDPERRCVCFVVADTGPGIPEAQIAHIWERLWTTKGKGTGLGLALAAQIIKDHGGFIEVKSSPQGTQFSIYLPVAGEDKKPQPKAEHDGQRRTLLLVDDEDGFRVLVALALESANYRVLSARSGAEAMKIFLREMDNISAVITDVAMTPCDGPQLLKALRELKPALKGVYVTGSQASDTYDPAPSAFLKKPFVTTTLLKVLQDII